MKRTNADAAIIHAVSPEFIGEPWFCGVPAGTKKARREKATSINKGIVFFFIADELPNSDV